jgi:hypothetical protein
MEKILEVGEGCSIVNTFFVMEGIHNLAIEEGAPAALQLWAPSPLRRRALNPPPTSPRGAILRYGHCRC